MRYLVILFIALAGCETTKQSESVWHKHGASDEQFFTDRGQCQAQGLGAMQGPMSMQAAMVFGSCMHGKGWRLEKR